MLDKAPPHDGCQCGNTDMDQFEVRTDAAGFNRWRHDRGIRQTVALLGWKCKKCGTEGPEKQER